MGILSKFFGAREVDLPDILCNTEEGFADLTFAIVGRSQQSDGSWHFNLRAKYDGAVVGLEVVLGANWTEGGIDLGDGERLPTFRGVVEYRSIGKESDRFVSCLGRLYELGSVNPMMPSTKFTAISLGGDPRRLENEDLKIKLFYETQEEDEYAEVFTNISYDSGVIEIREKDPDYRFALIKAISNEV